jgi:hypothetical protein
MKFIVESGKQIKSELRYALTALAGKALASFSCHRDTSGRHGKPFNEKLRS